MHLFFFFREQFTLNCGSIKIKSLKEFSESQQKENPPLELVTFKDIAESITVRLGLNNNGFSSGVVNEIVGFLKTGDFDIKTNKIVCINPTLLTIDDDKLWDVSINSLLNILYLDGIKYLFAFLFFRYHVCLPLYKPTSLFL